MAGCWGQSDDYSEYNVHADLDKDGPTYRGRRARVYRLDLLPTREVGELEGDAVRCFLGAGRGVGGTVGRKGGHFDGLRLVVSTVMGRGWGKVIGGHCRGVRSSKETR